LVQRRFAGVLGCLEKRRRARPWGGVDAHPVMVLPNLRVSHHTGAGRCPLLDRSAQERMRPSCGLPPTTRPEAYRRKCPVVESHGLRSALQAELWPL
jgi:hypothetical protein